MAPCEAASELSRDSSTSAPDAEASALAWALPRVLLVSRRTVRKNKFVDFVGEYHLDLVVEHGAVPIIVPRVHGIADAIDSLEPIHGVLLCEGEDIDPSLYQSDFSDLTPEEIEEMKTAHSSDMAIDNDKDSIEFALARRCLERKIPYLGICRGSQVLNVACGGSLYQDVELELTRRTPSAAHLKHIDYNNYDDHRHAICVVPGTPLASWFAESLKMTPDNQLRVNSYHHQGSKRLGHGLVPMATAEDGLVEAFYSPDCYDPERGRFLVGLQFHPERMRIVHDGEKEIGGHGEGRVHGGHATAEGKAAVSDFDYPECPKVYEAFCRAVVAFARRQHKENRTADSSAPSETAAPGTTNAAAGDCNKDTPLPAAGDAHGVPEKQKQRQLLQLQSSFRAAKQEYEARRVLRRMSSLQQRGNRANSDGLEPARSGGGDSPHDPAAPRGTHWGTDKAGRRNSDPTGQVRSADGAGGKLEFGASFLEANAALARENFNRLAELGVTMHKSQLYANLHPKNMRDGSVGAIWKSRSLSGGQSGHEGPGLACVQEQEARCTAHEESDRRTGDSRELSLSDNFGKLDELTRAQLEALLDKFRKMAAAVERELSSRH